MSRARLAKMLVCLLLASAPGLLPALQSDRQQPLDVKADSTDGTLGDGVTTLRGNVEIRQGSLLIKATVAEVDKADGKVTQVTLRGDAAYLEQEVEEQGLVKAWAERIEYQVANGMVIFSGSAEVRHPQYEVSGDTLRYDLEAQHFEGVGEDSGDGRIRIRLDPEVLEDIPQPSSESTDSPADDSSEGESAYPDAAR
ncbi:MAG: lipopolysaccharide transport periplasmic protein LptA [Lysobacterales bacterium]